MRAYRQDPYIYRNHFVRQTGGDLPGFKGTRVQYADGIGSFLGALARKAIPIIKAGVKLAAPHVKKAGKEIAKDLTGQVLSKASEKFSQKMRGKGRRRKKRKNKRSPKRRNCVRKRKGSKRARSNDIFMQ